MPGEFLLGVPGKLKTLLDRLTATRAGYLDNLDAAMTTRAPLSTALSTATWTATRAGYLDNLDIASSLVPRGAVCSSPYFLPRAVAASAWYINGTSSSYTATSDSFFSAMAYNGAQAVITGASTYVTCVNVTSGTGIFLNAIAPHGNSSSNVGYIKITVDGTEGIFASQNGSINSALVLGPFLPGDPIALDNVTDIPIVGGTDDKATTQVTAGTQRLGASGLLPTPEVALAFGMPVVWFSSSLKVEMAATIYSTSNAAHRCAAQYILRG